MKKVIRLLTIMSVIGISTLCMTSCSEKTQAIRDLEALAEEVQEHSDKYGFLEWKDVYYQYQAINVKIDRYYAEYSQKQKNRIMTARAEIRNAAWGAVTEKLDWIPDDWKKKFLEAFKSLGDLNLGTTEESDSSK